LCFVISRVHHIVPEIGEGDKSKMAAYATLIVFKDKIEIVYLGIRLVYNLVQKWREDRKKPKNELEQRLVEPKEI
jgi:hypothetical protein